MSTSNIIRKYPTPEGVVVVFQTRSGDSRAYLYGFADGAAIMAGADPHSFPGTETSELEGIASTAAAL